ncbi:MAG TPA: substrate-binding domain-containing protein [Xanthobacteraceae bacterium]|jgi:molybdate transport system substrate-binding protein
MEILCTNGLKSVMTELVPAIEGESGSKVVLTWGSTVALGKEIAAGARGDIAILTREAIEDLAEQGKAVAGSRIDLARCGIGIAVRKGTRKPDIGSPEALRRAFLAAKSVAHSRTGQSGIYFPTVLERLGITEQVKGKLVVPEGGMPIGEVVASGDAEMGIQQISELMPVDGIDIVGPLPEPLQKITVFSAGVLSTAQDPKRARAVIELIGTASRPLLASKGLEAP